MSCLRIIRFSTFIIDTSILDMRTILAVKRIRGEEVSKRRLIKWREGLWFRCILFFLRVYQLWEKKIKCLDSGHVIKRFPENLTTALLLHNEKSVTQQEFLCSQWHQLVVTLLIYLRVKSLLWLPSSRIMALTACCIKKLSFYGWLLFNLNFGGLFFLFYCFWFFFFFNHLKFLGFLENLLFELYKIF